MLLILRIQTYCHQPALNSAECRFSGAGGTLGRSADNDLVLDDPGKYISRVHAKISFRAGSYFLEDVGSNPSVVNDLPLGKGRELMLAHGDRIVVGDYQLEARVESVQALPASIAPAPFNNPALPLFEPPLPVDAAPLPPLLPVSAEQAAALAGPAVVLPDALASARILDMAAGFKGEQGAGFGAALHDPLGLNLFGTGAPVPAPMPGFGAVGPKPIAPFMAADIELASPEFAAFSMPAPEMRAANLAIPDDYDPLADFFPPPAVAPFMPAPPAVASLAPLPEPSAIVAPAPVPVPVQVPTRTATVEDSTVYNRQGAPEPALASTLPGEARNSENSGNPDNSDSAVLQALLRGLGLPNLPLKGSAPELAETVGALLREATAGTMALLMARTATKKESRVDTTMIAVRSNNPLKFFPNAESALTQMLTHAMAGYLPAVKSMEGAFSDLKVHELAVMAGTRAALGAVLHRFDPAQIEAHLAQPGLLDKMLGANRKARMWDRFTEVYGDIARDADGDLQRLFGEQFSEAYEDQVERLHQAGI